MILLHAFALFVAEWIIPICHSIQFKPNCVVALPRILPVVRIFVTVNNRIILKVDFNLAIFEFFQEIVATLFAALLYWGKLDIIDDLSIFKENQSGS